MFWSAIVSGHLHKTEPDAVKGHCVCHFHCWKFYAAGVNDVWVQDQHDKWGPWFGLWLHNNLDPFTGYNNWLKVWWTNKNPHLIAGYYIEMVWAYSGALIILKSPILIFINISCSYSPDNSEWSWIRELWCCEHSHSCLPWAQSDTFRHFAALLEAEEEQCQIWSQLVSLLWGFCTGIWGFIQVRCQSRVVPCW